jgi:hypothetical protein
MAWFRGGVTGLAVFDHLCGLFQHVEVSRRTRLGIRHGSKIHGYHL